MDKKLLLIILCVIPKWCQGQEWIDPFFEDAGTEKVEFKGLIGTDTYEMNMDEEIEFPYNLVKIKYSGGIENIKILFLIGTSQDFGDEFQPSPNGDGVFLRITKRQDFENPANQYYKFRITINKLSKEIELIVNNIFDNAPIITYNGPCYIDELEDPNFITDCKLIMNHPDGLLNNPITHEILGQNDEANIFALDLKDSDSYNEYYTVKVLKTLHYEERSFYNFEIKFSDVVLNSSTIKLIIQINDLPNMPPHWLNQFTMKQFDELTVQNFVIEATDGDTGLNEPIEYFLTFDKKGNYSDFLSLIPIVGNNKVTVHVKEIDRDFRKMENFYFNITAFKKGIYNGNEYYFETESIALITVVDINNKYPEITISTDVIRIRESEHITLPFSSIIVNDLDLGPNALYNVSLSQKDGAAQIYSSAFSIIPNTGYQEADYFKITVINAALLDYENYLWRTFDMTIVSRETNHTRSKTFKIELINWNDELPKFINEEYYVSINETVPGGTYLTQIRATDRDVDDTVVHSIVGSMNKTLRINESNGKIYTINNDTFDYDSQTEIFVQIMGQDTLQSDISVPHKTYARLTINVLDENNKTPTLTMPRVPAVLRENSTVSLVTKDIFATDPDTTAFLEFEIWWNQSYATKYGLEVDGKLYEGCFEIIKYPESINKVYGQLIVKPEFYHKIDYELYEVIFLTIRVIDRNQTYNQDYAEATLTVRIEDINDCRPIFVDDTLKVERRVSEGAQASTLIGTIIAFDEDGPGNNIISYSIMPADDSPDEWVSIDEKTGVIHVYANEAIDCDVPKRDSISYIVTLDDSVWSETGIIKIDIIDTNNKIPQLGVFQTEIYMKEKVSTTGENVETVIATDLDRDELFHKLGYSINYKENPKILDFFDIDHDTGHVTVNLKNNKILDRDRGDKTHDIRILITDNINGQGRTNIIDTNIHIILIDINDNKPEFLNNFLPTFEENQIIGGKSQELCADDADDALNAKIDYTIMSILPKLNNAQPAPDMAGVFKINNLNNCGQLEIAKSLEGYYGTWDLDIKANDNGYEDEIYGMQNNSKVFSLIIKEYNFNTPNIIVPTDKQSFRLRFLNQRVGMPLYFNNDSLMNPFEAKDMDGGIFGKVTFNVKSTNENDDGDYFQMSVSTSISGIHSSYLMLKKELQFPKTYHLTLMAIDGGNLISESVDIKVTFINLEGFPYFDPPIQNIEFHENSTGMEEAQTIEAATDPWDAGKDEDEEKETLYYFIDPTFKPEDSQYFVIDKSTAVVTLQEMLDRENIDNHTFKVIASRTDTLPNYPDPSSFLLVKVKVLDVNDNPPVFDGHDYGTGITVNDYLNKTLLTVTATDLDLNDSLSYRLMPESMEAFGKNIDSIKDIAFTLVNVDETGVLLLNFIPKSNMEGYFEFKIEVRDEVNHTDETTVKIYIISDDGKVLFEFINPLDVISTQENQNFLKTTFEEHYQYTCYIDDITQADDAKGIPQEDLSNVYAHFVKNNEIIPALKIQSVSSDEVFSTKLKAALMVNNLNLKDVPRISLTDVADTSQLLQTILIVVSVVLALLCIVLMITLFLRVRNLKRELNAITPVNMFGSTESNMNRIGAPTTNEFSVEGSNPVLNYKENCKSAFDNISIQSDESDFAGISNDLTFMPNEKRGSINPAMIEGMRRKSKNPMAQAHTFDDNKE